MANENGREEVPLRMLKGNIGVLLNNVLPCKGISLKHDPYSNNGVILTVYGVDHEAVKELNFKLRDN